MVLDDLAEVLGQLRELDPSALADAESIVSLHRHLATLEAVATRATASFDAAGDWAADGAQTAAAWITATCRVPKKAAQRRVRRGRELRFLPETERAWVGGDITGDHVEVMGRLRRPGTEEALARDEALLVDQATELTFAHFSRAAAYWGQLADPDGADKDAERRQGNRDAFLVQSFAGTWLGGMTLDPVRGASWPASSNGSTPNCSRPTGPGPKPSSAVIRDRGTRWPAPPDSAGPTPWWRWPSARRAARPGPGDRPRSSPSSWAGRPCTGGPVSSRTAPWSPRGHCCPGWTGPMWSGPPSPPVAG